MKRIVLAFLCVCLLVSCFASFEIKAVDEAKNDDADLEAALSYTCFFHADTSTIELSGTTNHSTMVSNSNASLMVYSLMPGMELADLLASFPEPIAKSDISIKFHFSIKVDNVLEKYSRYAIFLCSTDGTMTLAAEPQYPIIASSTSNASNKNYYKGLSMPLNESIGSGMMAGTTVIPISIDSMINRETNGYLYHNANAPYYFETAYVDALDVKIRSATATGSQVYLQYLLPSKAVDMAYVSSMAPEAEYALPDVWSASVLHDIEALTGFLMSRYDDTESGKLNGIVVGKGIDRPERYQYSGPIPAERYAKLYTLYLIAVSNSARMHDPSCEIVIPFTDVNPSIKNEDPFSPSALLELILQEMESGISTTFSIKTLVETDLVPFGITNATIEEGIDLTYESDNSHISVLNFKQYQSYLTTLQRKYTFAPYSCMVVWNVPADLTENALACAYTYSYFSLLGNRLVDSFIIACSNPNEQLADLRQILTCIDTTEALSVTHELLPYFGAENWNEILSISNFVRRDAYTMQATSSVPNAYKGAFTYDNYSASVEVENWYMGENCAKIKSEYHNSFGRAIRMDMLRNADNDGWYGEAFCLYDFEEYFAYTPYLAFRLFCEEENALYEIQITVGNKAECLEASYALISGKQQQIVLNIQSLGQDFRASYLRIRVRPLTEKEGTYSIWLQDIVGYSMQYDDNTLSEMIQNQRQTIRNEAQPEVIQGEARYVWVVFTVLLVTGSVAIGIFILLRREESPGDKD